MLLRTAVESSEVFEIESIEGSIHVRSRGVFFRLDPHGDVAAGRQFFELWPQPLVALLHPLEKSFLLVIRRGKPNGHVGHLTLSEIDALDEAIEAAR